MGGENCTIMKSESHSEMHEGRQAFDRFRKAVKTIVNVPKNAVVPAKKVAAKKKRAAKS
jgi:hypothetical protein